MTKYLIPALSALILFCCSEDDNNVAKEDGNLYFSGRLLNIAHRGGALLAPENTIEAFESALDAGADVLEMDMHSSSDGVLVIIHDTNVDRTTDGTGAVNDMTLEELTALDAGYNFSSDGATYPFRGSGIKIPTLRGVFEKFSGEYMLIEIKQFSPSIVDDFLALIDEFNMLEKVVVGSFNQASIDEIREKQPDIMTGMGPSEMLKFNSLTEAGLGSYEPPCVFVQAPFQETTESLLEKATTFNLVVHVWTVNTENDMLDMIALGVNGIMTDDPKLLDELIP